MDLAEGLRQGARIVRALTVVVLLMLASGAVGLQQFERSWGVSPLGDPPTSQVAVVGIEPTDGR
ncbi:hypothetical protein [Aeromicrobium sp. CTD01-1L150]|uniref:hypothetical protein n=1 Tax=Aeromicrobium sp. CTD01-1L150 TaxID=3341830 RepID=UPI0035BFB08E